MVSSSVIIALFAICFVSTMGHSQMRCAKFDPATGNCYAPIRNSVVSFESEAYDMTSGSSGVCQSAWSSPISNQYSNGAGCPDYAGCPGAMGTYTAGETFNVMWLARNHAVADQTPGNISLYLSPAITSGQNADVSAAVFRQNKFCTAPFASCNGQNGNMVQCYTSCTMPTNTASGTYTLWWKWDWLGHSNIYSTCADIVVTSSGSSTPMTPSTPSTPVSVPTPAPTPVPTPAPVPVAVPTPAPVPVAVPTPAPTPVATPTPAPVSVPTPSTPSSSPAPSSGSCTPGTMKCLSGSTYSTCTWSVWGAAQSCGLGTVCSPSGDYIYCSRSSTPISTPSAAPTTPVSSPAAPVPVAVPTPAATPASGSCTLGYQRCSGSSTYQTCGNGNNGPAWAANQNCQAGLSCHASSTANNIYCY